MMLKSDHVKPFDMEWMPAKRTILALLRCQEVSHNEWQELFVIIHRICTWVVEGSRLATVNLFSEINQHVSAVYRRMLHYWNKIVFERMRARLSSASMRLIESERNGTEYSPDLIIAIRHSYISLNSNDISVYQLEFEKAYIECAEKYYKSNAPEVLETNGVKNYMTYADSRLLEEEERGHRYLDPGAHSVDKLLERLVQVIVEQFEDQILGECNSLLKSNHMDMLKKMYRLINRTSSGIPKILGCLDQYIRIEAFEEMKANVDTITTDPEKYVEQLLLMFERFTDLISVAFYDDPRFLTTRDQAFQDVVSDTRIFKIELCSSKLKAGTRVQVESKCPELLANFCDLILRKTAVSKRLNSDEVDTKLNQVLLVLKYVANKDVFMRFYKAHLTRRLILEISVDQEKEEQVVTRMREMGMPAEYINKLYRMLQDIELSKDINNSFKKGIGKNKSERNDLIESVSLKVLNAGAWSRFGEKVQLQLPRELEDILPEVDEFYRKQHNGRKLQWFHHWSYGTVSFSNNVGKFDLDVTTLQLSVLFCWNDRPHDQLSFETLRIATQLAKADLSRTLSWLVAFPKMKHQILLTDCKSMNFRDFTDSTLFWLNQQFAIYKNGKDHSRGRINLIGRLQLSMEQNSQDEHDDILQLRAERIQEAIVKIMKVRKRCPSAQLQTELIELVKNVFLPSKRLFKEQIEWLIENKYIERDPNDFNVFLYVS